MGFKEGDKVRVKDDYCFGEFRGAIGTIWKKHVTSYDCHESFVVKFNPPIHGNSTWNFLDTVLEKTHLPLPNSIAKFKEGDIVTVSHDYFLEGARGLHGTVKKVNIYPNMDVEYRVNFSREVPGTRQCFLFINEPLLFQGCYLTTASDAPTPKNFNIGDRVRIKGLNDKIDHWEGKVGTITGGPIKTGASTTDYKVKFNVKDYPPREQEYNRTFPKQFSSLDLEPVATSNLQDGDTVRVLKPIHTENDAYIGQVGNLKWIPCGTKGFWNVDFVDYIQRRLPYRRIAVELTGVELVEEESVHCLATSKHKYAPGNKVWFIFNYKIIYGTIADVAGYYTNDTAYVCVPDNVWDIGIPKVVVSERFISWDKVSLERTGISVAGCYKTNEEYKLNKFKLGDQVVYNCSITNFCNPVIVVGQPCKGLDFYTVKDKYGGIFNAEEKNLSLATTTNKGEEMTNDTLLQNSKARLESIKQEQSTVLAMLKQYKREQDSLKETIDNIGGLDLDFPAAASEDKRIKDAVASEIKKSKDLEAERKALQDVVDLLEKQKEENKS